MYSQPKTEHGKTNDRSDPWQVGIRRPGCNHQSQGHERSCPQSAPPSSFRIAATFGLTGFAVPSFLERS